MSSYSQAFGDSLDRDDSDKPPAGKYQFRIIGVDCREAKRGKGDEAVRIGDVFEWEVETADEYAQKYKIGQWLTKKGAPDFDMCRFVGKNALKAGVTCESADDFFDPSWREQLVNRVVDATIKRGGDEGQFVNLYIDQLIDDGRVRLPVQQQQKAAPKAAQYTTNTTGQQFDTQTAKKAQKLQGTVADLGDPESSDNGVPF